MIFLISLFPIILYLLLISSLDGFSLCRTSKILKYLSWGVISCLTCTQIARMMPSIIIDNDGFIVIEEVMKALPIIVNVFKRKSAFFTETLTYGAAIGAGFSLVENIIYILVNPAFAFGDALIRGVGTSLIHIGCTALCGCCCLVLKHVFNNQPNAYGVIMGPAAMIPSLGIHFLYNQFFMSEFVQMFLVVIVFIVFFLIIFKIDRTQIHGWLDECIANDITLLASIKDGKMKETQAGQYLLAAKERFKPEVFFDICMYLSLFLELTIAAKSRVILNESGIEMPITPEEHKSNKEKLAELLSLRKAIGKSGHMLLSPLVNDDDKDEWVMKQLL